MYLDTSIIVKLLVAEPDSEFFIRSLEGQRLTTSELAQTEVFSALLARERAGKIKAADRRLAWKEFQARVANEEIRIEPLNSVVLRKATHCLEYCHPPAPLRTLDAIHLATADLCQDFPLVTTDVRLANAARAMHIPVFPEPSSKI
ncbi:MAG TPA: type II toxin-antitoxin system VapC family toxin [Verrucomicrobiae bacterium]|jgi:predicted nucleic acid-binding protein|nr:type II toxin-antitoxin system VapC family toxin [Verrucomicrobiae bacterium]